MRRDFTSVGPVAARVDVLDMMRARDISQVPILDGRGRLIGLHLLRELLGTVDRENWAVIMAGGPGVRQHPPTARYPKLVLPVAGPSSLDSLCLPPVSGGRPYIILSANCLSEL